MRYSLERDAALHVPGGVGLAHVVALEIAEQPHRIAAEARRRSAAPAAASLATGRSAAAPRRRAIGLSRTSIGTWQPAQPSVVELPAAALEVVGEARRRRRQQRLRGRRRAGGPGSAARRSEARAAPGAPIIAANGPRPSSPRMPSPSGIARIVRRRRRRRGEPLASSTSLWMPMCTCSASAAKSREGRRACPSSRTASRPGRRRRRGGRTHRSRPSPSTRSTPKSTPLVVRRASRAAPARAALAHEVGALPLQVAAHLARQRLHDAEPHQRRRVALVAARRALAVARRGTRCRSRRRRRSGRRPSGTRGRRWFPDRRRARRARDGTVPAGAVADAPPPSPSAKPYSCSKSSCPRSASSAETDVAGGHALRHRARRASRAGRSPAPRPRAGAARVGARPRGAPRAPPPG